MIVKKMYLSCHLHSNGQCQNDTGFFLKALSSFVVIQKSLYRAEKCSSTKSDYNKAIILLQKIHSYNKTFLYKMEALKSNMDEMAPLLFCLSIVFYRILFHKKTDIFFDFS